MKKKILLLTLGILCLTSSIAFAKPKTERIYGNTKYETSAKISSYGWENSKYAVLVSGEDFADALSASPLAKKYNAPLLLTTPKELDKSIKDELKRLNVETVIIVGGEGAISNEVENVIKSLGINTTRLAGKNRYDTSLEVAKKLDTSNGVFLATGYNYADSLSASSIAGIKQMPILLTPENELPKNISDFLNNSNHHFSYILGGPSVISEAIDASVSNPYRIYGDDRYETNYDILNTFINNIDSEKVYMASGMNYHDALCLSALASKTNSCVFLANNKPSNKLDDLLNYWGGSIKDVIVIGDENTVNNDCLNLLSNINNIKDFSSDEFLNKLNNGCKFYSDLNFLDFNKKVPIPGNDLYSNYRLKAPYETKEKLLNELSKYFSRAYLSNLKFNKINNEDYLEFYQTEPKYSSDFLVVNNFNYISDKVCVASIWKQLHGSFSSIPITFVVEDNELKIDNFSHGDKFYEINIVFNKFFDEIKKQNKSDALISTDKFKSYIGNFLDYQDYISKIETSIKNFNGPDDEFSAFVESLRVEFIKFYNAH
ncbi:cell wall-binding repeat-containing protein [Clostridium ihumii]|uniref:cell wall-binding repeat-containing protein n=1 Tax=Clostridium ihumii TaxID=1470356 RepID=UPI003D33532A